MFAVSSDLAYLQYLDPYERRNQAKYHQTIIHHRVISFIYYLWIAAEQSLDRLDDPAEKCSRRLSRC
jgi:hypothetical protein